MPHGKRGRAKELSAFFADLRAHPSFAFVISEGMSDFTDAIGSRGPLVGTMVTLASPVLAEALSWAGLDWLMFDLEHSVMTLLEAQTMIQAMERGCLSMIRVEEPAALAVKRALDTGCSGVIVPQVNSLATAREIAAAGRYPPDGNRGVGLSRALGYGATLEKGVKEENARIAVIVQIEHVSAVEAVEEIVAVEGIDGVFVGPYDLSASFGIPGEVSDQRVLEGIGRVAAAARAARKPAGIFVSSSERAQAAVDQGFQFVAVGGDLPMLVGAVRNMCAAVRPTGG
jgi:2-dehydro-3-deoxyglucarate aldolase/4-hydroxy-2-oxoheptanedioate aldolase